MVRPVRLAALLAVLLPVGVALAAPGTAAARQTPPGEIRHVVVVDRMSDATFALLSRRGAVGLLRPSYGPTTNRRRALAELVRGTEVNARLGGVLHGLLASPTTHIPGLVSIVDIAPTDLGGHPATSLSWKPSRPTAALGQLSRLDHAIGANNRLKFAALFILAGVLLALALLGLRAAVTAVPAALLVNIALGMGQVSNEVLLCAALSAGTVLLALWLARVCRSDSALL